MTDNPYAAPAADLSVGSATPIRMYTPGQVAGGVFLGGPFGLVYFLHANFTALGNEPLARKTLVYGVLFAVAALTLAGLLPKGVPSMPINVAYMLTAQQLALKYQLSKETIATDPRYRRHSNWRVAGFSVICILATLVAVFAVMAALAPFGVKL